MALLMPHRRTLNKKEKKIPKSTAKQKSGRIEHCVALKKNPCPIETRYQL